MDRRQRVQDLFERAEPVPAGERSALLASLCDDESIRAEVASLLEHSEAAPDRFMRPPPAAEGLGAPVEDPLIGTQVGRFHIERVLGAGGMGTVYLATQDNPRRKAAVKVLRPAYAAPQTLRRFEFESRVLAHLSHPNIAHVYEAGVHRLPPSGLSAPYFAMEYIPDALPITTYAREKGLSVRQRLELFEQVCGAVHHGHQKGIIHRDLKPGNILVDAAGVPKVIDFGVARGTDADLAITTLQTDAGQLIGTLQYMSPEQCDADPLAIDTRSDVYSLGVVLYELLTDRLPYETAGTSIYAATRIIRESAAPRLSTVHRRFRGDLELIVDKAVRKDREGRYASSAGLQRDIRNFLDGAPIEARPPTRLTRLNNWVRRHPLAVTGMACAVLFLVSAVTVAIASWAVWRNANLAPYRVDIDPKRQRARLITFTQSTLYEWGDGNPQTVFGAETLMNVAGSTAQLAMIGFGANNDDPFAGKLCAFDAHKPDKANPVWCDRIDDGEMPRNERPGFAARDFQPTEIWFDNIFASVPGDEIVAMFVHTWSYRAVRVYQANGTILYEFWHNGAISSVAAMQASELLVVAGQAAGEDTDGYWGDYDHPDASEMRDQHYPLVLFALPLELGFRSQGLLRLGIDKSQAIRWLTCLQPSKKSDMIKSFRLDPPLSEYQDGRHILLTFRYIKNDRAFPGRHIDHQGRLVGPVLGDDHYNRDKTLPRLEELRFGPLPPLLPK